MKIQRGPKAPSSNATIWTRTSLRKQCSKPQDSESWILGMEQPFMIWRHSIPHITITPKRHRCTSRFSLSLKKRSQEHTSELQSPVHLVCSLLLEKKNSNTRTL